MRSGRVAGLRAASRPKTRQSTASLGTDQCHVYTPAIIADVDRWLPIASLRCPRRLSLDMITTSEIVSLVLM
jgi:hypothetical protein